MNSVTALERRTSLSRNTNSNTNTNYCCFCDSFFCFPLNAWFCCPLSNCYHRNRNRRRNTGNNRVGPSVPNKVIIRRINSNGQYFEHSNNSLESEEQYNNRDYALSTTTSSIGITNQTFQADNDNNERIITITTDIDDDDENETDAELGKKNSQPTTTRTTNVPIQGLLLPRIQPVPSLNANYLKYSSSIFLKTGPGKCIHVTHIKTKNSSTSRLSQRNCTFSKYNSSNSNSTTNLTVPTNSKEQLSSSSASSGDEDEDEYWFSKWSKRPKLKNTFKPLPPEQQLSTNEANISQQASAATVNANSNDGSKLNVKYKRFNVSKCDNNTCTNSHHQNNVLKGTTTAINPATATCISSAAEDKVDPNESTNISANQVHLDFDLTEQNLTTSSNNSSFGCTNLAYQPELDPHSRPPSSSPVPDLVESTTNSNRLIDKTDQDIGGTHCSSNNSPSSAASKESLQYDDESLYKSHNNVSNHISNSNNKTVSSAGLPLLFFIHGISSSSDIWTNQIEFFHKLGYELVLIDLLGHGLSSTPTKSKFYTFESLLQDIVYVYDYFTPSNSSSTSNRPTVLIGHGYGSCFASVLSRIRPANVASLISFSGGGPTPMAPNGCLRPPGLIPFQLTNFFAKKREFGRFDPIELKHVLPQNIRQALIDGQIWIECDTAFHHKIKIPTLLIYGLRDKVVTLVEECEMEKAIPKSFLELLPFAGHFSMCDEPKKCNRMIYKFIQGWVQ